MLKPFYNKENKLEAGCDEAGRGCLAGPVVAAAVILPKNFKHSLLNDSKKMSEKNRLILKEIIEKEAIAWSVEFIDNVKVDEINVLNASILGMQNAVLSLSIIPDFVIIDGNRFKPFKIPHECIIKGDAKFNSIAAASVLAKTYRDAYMQNIHMEHPAYSWDKNKGYPSLAHRKKLIELGPTKYHRLSFRLKETNKLKLSL